MKVFLKRSRGTSNSGYSSNSSDFKRRKKAKPRRRLRENHRTVEAFSGIRQSEELLQEVQWLWDNAGGDRLSAKSFWIGRDDTPSCCLEAFALECAAFHCPESFLGAEYWVQIRTGATGDEGGLDFHFDKDESLLKTQDIWCHPHSSTVTYLKPTTVSEDATTINEIKNTSNNGSESTPANSDPLWGAPLVVFNTTSSEPSVTSPLPPYGAEPSRAWVLFPRPGNHVKFRGNLLHGVPSELNAHIYTATGATAATTTDATFTSVPVGACNNDVYKRMSLPVNIWTQHQPQSVQRLSSNCLLALQQYKLSNPIIQKTPSNSAHALPASSPSSSADSDDNDGTFFRLSSLEPVPLCPASLPSLSIKDDLRSLDKTTLPPDFDPSQVLFLGEHAEGSTGHLPLQLIREELCQLRDRNTSRNSGSNGDKSECSSLPHAGIKISYF